MGRRAKMRLWTVGLLGALFSASAPVAVAQDSPPPGAPGVIVRGSDNVSVGGMPAGRGGDPTHDGGALEQGSPNVSINGRPAVTVGDRTNCGSVTVRGSSNVYVNGKPLARAGDATTGCPVR